MLSNKSLSWVAQLSLIYVFWNMQFKFSFSNSFIKKNYNIVMHIQIYISKPNILTVP